MKEVRNGFLLPSGTNMCCLNLMGGKNLRSLKLTDGKSSFPKSMGDMPSVPTALI